eukprot:TRINITY_DN12895_c0_g1_i1.p1 TRINITY_DN12895_c0_g1~~TRINITY_DN12895_c0_g1_i1.p1  ORF type:complete len:351 (+),score=80.63 TRINITY_DN12895_c0_g1_i1:3-1055(+)
MQLRGAWDVGSGTTKLQVAWVNTATNPPTVDRVVLNLEQEILLGIGLQRDGTGRLSDELCQKLMSTIENYKEQAQLVGTEIHSGVATAVFRKATNGLEILNSINQKFSLNLKLITQELEGKLGFMTACALATDYDPETIVSWDIGGASFQITTLLTDQDDSYKPQTHTSHYDTANLAVFEGPIGDSQVLKILLEVVQKKDMKVARTPNPVSPAEILQLLMLLEQILPLPPPSIQKKINTKTTKIVTFGGFTNCFRIFSIILKKTKNFIPSELESAINTWTQEFLERSTGGQLGFEGVGIDQEEIIPQEELVIPKLCLVLAVARKFGISSFDWYRANGSTNGILVTPQMWS